MFTTKVKENYRVSIFHTSMMSESYNIRETLSGLQKHIRKLVSDKSNYQIEVFKGQKLVFNLINN